eukprot:3259786-Amphidinium_carterae.1
MAHIAWLEVCAPATPISTCTQADLREAASCHHGLTCGALGWPELHLRAFHTSVSYLGKEACVS